MAMGKGYRVFHKVPPDTETPYSVLMDSKAIDESLMFESGAVVVLTMDEVESLRKQYTKVIDAYGCLGALCLNTGNGQIQYIVMVTSCLSVGKIGESEVFRITGVQFIPLSMDPSDEDRVSEIRKLLNSGTFYFTWKTGGSPWDLSLCAQRTFQDHDTDNRFFWNRMLHVHFQRYGVDCSKWLLRVMCGGVEIRTIYAGHRQAKACLISRLSCERAGTRFNVRGVNDDGNVANFVETEQVIFLEEQIASFVQTRGSVPLFWEQPGLQVGSHKVHMSRGYEMAAPAYDRHLRAIRQRYGDQVIVNLLGSREGEQMVSQAFMNHHSASCHSHDVPYIHFDYHAEMKANAKNLDKLKARIIKYLHQFDFFCTTGETITHHQTGTIRTNCLDCLDRTNATQTMIGLEMLIKQLEALDLAAKQQMIGRFEEVYKQIWVHNGDHISRIYTGTGALGGGRSKYSDASRSATRTIQNNFLDGSKQEAIDVLLMGSSLHGALADRTRALLGTRYLHASENILRPMTRRFQEYTRTETYRVCVGTYNVNGGKHYRSIAYKHQSLADWLLDAHKTHPNILVDAVDYDKPVDIFAVGFEEIVDLNASNIMSASTTNAREWQKEVMKTISRDHKYVIVTSIQLVGVVLYVFVRPHLAPFIRDVAVDKVKTGLGGATGNKGGVAIRFLLNSTSICFVCAHLAAGQSQVNERNANYTEITRKMSFPMEVCRGRTILSHDCVFWCGDFNYRIDLPAEEVKSLISSENYGALQEVDQLNIQRTQNLAFQGFSEGPTNFAPTYKYDTFSDDYDTSDKSRNPAWTDRVLWRVKTIKDQETNDEYSLGQVRLLLYTRAELRTSDHRPVIALFDVDTLVTVEEKKNATLSKVISEQGPPDGTVVISTQTGEELSDEAVNEIVAKFNEVGDIVIVRFVGTDMWILFQSGQFALEALQFDQHQFAGSTVRVRLKTTEWRNEIEKELNLCSSNTGALPNQFSNSLLGDDFTVPSMEFDMDEDDDETADLEVENVLQTPSSGVSSGISTPSGQSSPALQGDIPGGPPVNQPRPARPPQPAGPPLATSVGAGWDSQVIKEEVPQLRTSPPESKQPPARPSVPPAKPPPPQRPPGGPPKPSPTHGQSIQSQSTNAGGQSKSAPVKIRQPLRPGPSDRTKTKKPQKIGQIGLPTNITHRGHASSIEEAQALIQKLMTAEVEQKPTGMALPTPLVPSRSETNLSTAGGQLAPKTVTRSHTSQEIGDATQAMFPEPMARKRSLDNIPVACSTSETTLSAKPIPTPRRDLQSSAVEGSSSKTENSADFSSTSKRPGGVQVLPSPFSSNEPTVAPRTAPLPPAVASRAAPPAPATRPAAALPEPKHSIDPILSLIPPVPPSRSAKQPQKTSDLFDASSGSSLVFPSNSHLLDREISMEEGKDPEPDPFDTGFAKLPSLPFNSKLVVNNSSDPFNTSSVSGVNKFLPVSDKTGEKSFVDPFDTNFAAQTVSLSSQALNDPFDTSSFSKCSVSDLSSSVSETKHSEQGIAFSSSDIEQFSPFSGDAGFLAPDMSPPPLPLDTNPIGFPLPNLHLTCPAETPPPPPKVNPSGPAVSEVVRPPVPNRPGNIPPPVPRRPV